MKALTVSLTLVLLTQVSQARLISCGTQDNSILVKASERKAADDITFRWINSITVQGEVAYMAPGSSEGLNDLGEAIRIRGEGKNLEIQAGPGDIQNSGMTAFYNGVNYRLECQAEL